MIERRDARFWNKADEVALLVSGLKFGDKRTWLTAAQCRETPPRLQRAAISCLHPNSLLLTWTACEFRFAY
jgi:hypothetical protein